MDPRYFYITTPIYYVNDKPHIGHAYTSVACDVLARFKRLTGWNVKFLTGTDEHGQKVEKSAQREGVSPQALADKNSKVFQDLADLMGLSNDDFIRTTEPRHIAAAQALWQRMEEAGHIYLGSYAGWYSVRDETYYAESELVGGKAPTGADVEWVEEPSYFFKLSAFEKPLLDYFEAHPECVGPPSRYNEVKSFVRGGLKDLSISRTTFSWGIPVPGNPKHIMYVWLDALTNYLSALGFPDNTPDYQHFWPASQHMVGKDILRFHAVFWPAFLMAANLPLPRKIFAHGWWTVEGEKISKSLGNAIPADELVRNFGLDAVRWFLMREVPFGNDGNFAREAVINRTNSELSNNIGNLAQRTLTLIQKNCDAKIPQPGSYTPDDIALLQESARICDITMLDKLMDNNEFNKYLDRVVELGNLANAYIDTQAPWTLKKTDPARMLTVLYVLAESIRKIAILISPIMPDASRKMLDLLAVPPAERDFAFLMREGGLKAETPLTTPTAIFPRISEPGTV